MNPSRSPFATACARRGRWIVATRRDWLAAIVAAFPRLRRTVRGGP